jgi:predicted DNA-binding transcriptional regulator AlpA
MELVGTSEIAELASTSRSAVSNWVTRDPSFPKPIADLACGQIWDKKEIEAWISDNKSLKGSEMNAINTLEVGKIYTHDFICKTFGGDAKGGTYLPQSNNKIRCGCFTKDMNSQAQNDDMPESILVGNHPRVLAKAKKLADQAGSIPVFLKLSTNQWKYMGIYELAKYSEDPADFEARAAAVGRVDIVAALFFRPI